MIVRDYYSKTRVFKKAQSAYDIARITLFLFWMPLIVFGFLYFLID